MLHPMQARTRKETIEFKHGKAEATGLGNETVDLVSACLVFHEVPTKGISDIIHEAYRILRPGGTFAIMVLPFGFKAFL